MIPNDHDTDPTVPAQPEAQPAVEPDFLDLLPEKFRDPETGQVRTDALVRSYLELERRMGGQGAQVPDSPDGYQIRCDMPHLDVDPRVNARLHQAGFSPEQAQLVYDLAGEYFGPLLTDVAGRFEAQRTVDRLAQRFGGEDRWGEVAARLRSWGQKAFSPEVYEALSSSEDGVMAMHRLMEADGGEPGLTRTTGGGQDLSEKALKKLMRDPRYWRDNDPELVAKVRDGFRRLYPE